MLITTLIESLSRGIDPSSPLGISIILIGLIFTFGLPLLLILKGRKD